MPILMLFAFIAGVVTILSPCILPVLPVILSSATDTNNKNKPIGVIIGFILSFTVFTLFLTTIVRIISVPADAIRLLSVFVILAFGISVLMPKTQLILENLFSRFSNLVPTQSTKNGFVGGIFIGASLGLLWTPCVGPILASVISLSLLGEVTFGAFFITLAYSIGTAIPMFMIMLGGNAVLKKVPWLTKNLTKIQKLFGVLMILTAITIYFGWDRKFQTYILDTFPNYGVGLTSIEDNSLVKEQLDNISNTKSTNREITDKDYIDRKVPAPEIIPGGQWFNSDPLSLESMRGKVFIVDFWTYSCINCQRTFPYLRDWWDKYKDDGLIILGVHSPEFEFEKDPQNVQQAIEDFGIKYPVVQDNNFSTWRAYNNRYWPAKYIIDKDGYVRYTHFGEGAYDETEEVIQMLLKEAGASNLDTTIQNPGYKTYAQTPETYLGYARIANFASPEKIVKDTFSKYSVPSSLDDNEVAFEGNWYVSKEYSNPKQGSKLYIKFNAKDVYLVMNPKNGQSQVKITIESSDSYYGKDVDDQIIVVNSDSLYHLVNLNAPESHILIIEFLDDNTEVYAFTFG